MPLRIFMIYSYVGALFWVSLFVVTGYELGIKWYFIKQSFEAYKIIVYFGVSILLSIVALLFFFRTKKKKP
ncbi:DedA family protein [Halalkalibacter alkalisediminis]